MMLRTIRLCVAFFSVIQIIQAEFFCCESTSRLIDETKFREIIQGSELREGFKDVRHIHAHSLSASDFEDILIVTQHLEFGKIISIIEVDPNLVRIKTELFPTNGKEVFLLKSKDRTWVVLNETLRSWAIIKCGIGTKPLIAL